MAKAGKPNILVLWGDDIGWWNISYNNRGQMGYRTPSIDRIGNEGATFTEFFERADENSSTYWDWLISHAYIIYEMQEIVARQIGDFVKYPPRQKPAAFDLDAVLRQLQDASGGGPH
jgi:hypothetical protein